ncbi:unnamed protein product [Cercopithifilaria johnstoni]|uniref:Uncharacterized protein n=1 Tax=Cercopithifilaria johnstoni TaxID=2874296 RepID=A0A8J2MQM3_9BILA|nr:unnamed protein product [Cercopithifilaria johnstoni]
MLRMLCSVLISTYILTTAALPIAVSNKKDSKFCCKCTIEDRDESTGKTVTNLGIGQINTLNVITHSLIDCEGVSATMVSSAAGGFIKTDGEGLINTYISGSDARLIIPSVQIRVPQVQLPAPVNIIPQQPYALYHFQPFINILQPKVSTQCCVPCPDGNGICCCTPDATTTASPRDSHTLYPPYHPAGAGIPLKSTSLIVVSTAILLVLNYIM